MILLLSGPAKSMLGLSVEMPGGRGLLLPRMQPLEPACWPDGCTYKQILVLLNTSSTAQGNQSSTYTIIYVTV